MNYLNYINQYWEVHDKEPLTPSATALYFYLLKCANKKQWKCDEFYLTLDVLVVELGRVNRNTIRHAQQQLVDAGLVEIIPGKHKGAKTIYRLKDISKGIVKDIPKGITKGTPKSIVKSTSKGTDIAPSPHYYNNLEYSNEYPKYEDKDKDKDKEKNILKNIQKENSSLSFDAIINQALSDNEKSWHEALLQKYGIKNLEQAIEDYKMHIELYPRQEPITSLSEFKRHFANIANNYPNFISEKAKQYKPVPIAVEFEQNGKRYVRQFGLDVLLPDNAPAKPTDSVSYYWDDTSLYWRRYG